MQNPSRCWYVILLAMTGLSWACVPGVALGDDGELRKLLDRLVKLEREVDDLKAKQGRVPADPKDQKIVLLLENVHLGTIANGAPNASRFLAAKVTFVNLTPQAYTVNKGDISLSADGQVLAVKDVPQQFQGMSVSINQQNLPIRTLQMQKPVLISAGGTAFSWVLIPDLPLGNHIPEMVLKVKLGEQLRELDVNAQQKELLAMTVERLGPRDALGLITLAGHLNSVNVGSLVREVDRMAADKVNRVVIRWTDTGTVGDPQLMNWLTQLAQYLGRQQIGEMQYPSLPSTIRELHLASFPKEQAQNYGYNSYYNNPPFPGASPRIHKNEAEAVMAALHPVYEMLPRDEVLKTIQTGQRLEKAAALANGGGRLDSEHLPTILKLADDNDPFLQQAALTALSHFGEQSAVDKLIHYARKNVEPLAGVAITSLAGSRYAAAHSALLDLLQNEPPASKKTIIKILAKHPRPVWSEAIYQFVKDSRSDLNADALQALVQVGHPKLVALLQETLSGSDRNLRQIAFNLLVSRTDRESEEIALNYTLGELKTAPPTPVMLTLLNRVKDKRALPLLAQHLQNNGANRAMMLQTLALIGDQDTARLIVEKYPLLQNHERGEALRALQKLHSPKFRELAAQALATNDSTVVANAVQGLQEDGSPESVTTLVEALETSTFPYTWSYLCNALSVIGTPAARQALSKARDAAQPEKRNYAINALNQMRQRSPGYQHWLQAQNLSKQEKWKETVDQLDLAINLDATLPDYYAERANAYVMLERWADAGKDYQKLQELDPSNSISYTGLCLTMVLQEGKHAEAVKKLEEYRVRFGRNQLFLYNAACVYGRAVSWLKKPENEKVVDREKLVMQYTQAALADLQRAVENGFQDFEWMKKDPDLKPFLEMPEFQKIATPPAGTDSNRPNRPRAGIRRGPVNALQIEVLGN